ncbi:hypothetical protein U9M48_011373 [Paspalum notatum var. saurae]|uniref:F-box domain-containing protein n=1 Tax=Paspalum notatum var. saurae TaxID=547442 RepID=A0AAQ3WHA6_PASNO
MSSRHELLMLQRHIKTKICLRVPCRAPCPRSTARLRSAAARADSYPVSGRRPADHFLYLLEVMGNPSDVQGQGWDGADVLVEILQRITPPSCRLRLRLVCRHWRNVIDERLPAPETKQARVKVLAVARGKRPAAADGRRRVA